MIISANKLIFYTKGKIIYLLVSSVLGGLCGLIYYKYSPKIYEVSAFLNLPYIYKKNQENSSENRKIIIPPVSEVRNFIMNPLNIEDDLLEICGKKISNLNRKKLINSIYLTSFDKNDKSIIIRVRLERLELAKSCTQGLLYAISIHSNDIKEKYLTDENINPRLIIINRNSEIIDKIIVSDSFVYPRIWINIFFGMLCGLIFAILISFIKIKNAT